MTIGNASARMAPWGVTLDFDLRTSRVASPATSLALTFKLGFLTLGSWVRLALTKGVPG